MENSFSSSRKTPPKHILCVGSVVTKGEQVLLVRQAQGHPLEGQWSVPWGFVDEDEFPDVAACRETLEESSIEAEILGLIGIQELHDRGWIAIVFHCRYIQGIPTPDCNGETDRARFFSLEEINVFEEPIEPWCEWIVRRVLEGNHVVIPLETKNPYDPLKSFL
jgi:ADP-ribose pyrophosphatase YjhB (NUDIX family)